MSLLCKFVVISPKLIFDFAPVCSKNICFGSFRTYSTQNNFLLPNLFNFTYKQNFSKQRKRESLRLKSERGVFAHLHQLQQNFEGVSSEEKEHLSDERSCFLVPNTSHEQLFLHTGQEYKLVSSEGIKATNFIQRGYDYYRNYARGEDVFLYKDPIFLFKKNKLGAYIFTKRTGGLIHTLKKKK
jgi:hypothetical protein